MDTVSHLLTSCAQDGETTCFRNVYPEGGIRIQRVDARGPQVSAPERIDGYDVVHLAPVMNEVELSPWLEAVGDTACAISVQGWIKTAGRSFRDAYPHVEESGPETARAVVQIPWMPPEDDLRKISIASLGAEDLIGQGDLLERLVGNIPIVACTHGRDGADIYVDGRPTRVGTYVVDDLDPTGAGDTFAAVSFTEDDWLDPVDAAMLSRSSLHCRGGRRWAGHSAHCTGSKGTSGAHPVRSVLWSGRAAYSVTGFKFLRAGREDPLETTYGWTTTTDRPNGAGHDLVDEELHVGTPSRRALSNTRETDHGGPGAEIKAGEHTSHDLTATCDRALPTVCRTIDAAGSHLFTHPFHRRCRRCSPTGNWHNLRCPTDSVSAVFAGTAISRTEEAALGLSSHIPSPQDRHTPQSAGQERQSSPSSARQKPSPQVTHPPQSSGQPAQVSFSLHRVSPQLSHRPQSTGQALQSSSASHVPSPQSAQRPQS